MAREVSDIASCWWCPSCHKEVDVGLHHLHDLRSGSLDEPRWCAEPNCRTMMVLLKRQRIYASEAERLIITKFERSDWGLLLQAVEHYDKNRRRTARRNPGADAVLARGVYPRFDALKRACGLMRREALPDTEDGGRIAAEAFDA